MRAASILLHCIIAAGLLNAQVEQDHSAGQLPKISMAAWSDALDGTDFAETPGYREVVEALLELKPEDIAAMHPVDLDPARALAEPASLRGTFVRVRGYVIGKDDVPLASPIGAQTKVQRVIVILDKEHSIACDLIGNPSPYDVKRDKLELCGVFYRIVSYTTQSGKELTLPYMLARSMELVETPASGLMKSLMGGGRELYLGVILGFVGVFVFVMYLRRSARSET